MISKPINFEQVPEDVSDDGASPHGEKESWFEFKDGKPIFHRGMIETKQIPAQAILDEASRAGETTKTYSLLAGSFLGESKNQRPGSSSMQPEKVAETAGLQKELAVIRHYLERVDDGQLAEKNTADTAWVNSLRRRIDEIKEQGVT